MRNMLRGFRGLSRRPRVAAFLVWLVCFFTLPPYVESGGAEVGEAIFSALSSSVIYEIVEELWPSLILHITLYLLLYLTVKRPEIYGRYFMIYAGVLYAGIAVGQGIAFTERFGLVIITSNVLLILLISVLWLRDGFRYKFEHVESGVLKLAPLALFGFIAPFSRTVNAVSPWFYMWKTAFKCSWYIVLPALALDALAGFGVAAYCLFTPISLTLMGYVKALKPLTLRLTSITGLSFVVIIWATTVLTLINSQATSFWTLFDIIWNAILHLPLLIICGYFFFTPYRV